MILLVHSREFHRGPAIREIGRPVQLAKRSMRFCLAVMMVAALAFASAGCGGEGEKGVIMHKEKPVPPPAVKPAEDVKK